MPLVVNGETVDDSLVREEAKKLRPRFYEMMGGGDPIELEMKLREWSKENVIERILLRQAAPDGDVAKFIESFLASIPAPAPKEVSDYFKEHKDDFFTPEMARVWHIHEPVDDTHEEASAHAAIQRIERDLQQGLLFDSFSKELGWIPKGRMRGELEREIFSLELRQNSKILRSTTGFHIIRVTERREACIPSFAEAREHVAELITRAKCEALIDRLVDTLKAKADIRAR